MSAVDRLAEVQARADAATPGRWHAESRQDVPDLAAALRAVLDVHVQDPDPVPGVERMTPHGICDHDAAPWPCPTVAAIEAKLGGDVR